VYLKFIEIENVRSLSSFKRAFSQGINLIYGKNGEGKTSILEAIHTLSITKSFRKGHKNNLQKTNTETMSIIGEFSGNKETRIAYRKNLRQIKIKINGREVKRLSEVIGIFPSIILSPEDIDIVSGGNSLRLTYINKILSISNKEYLETLTGYNKILKLRNRCLVDKKPYSETVVWDIQMISKAQKIWELRELFMEQFNEQFNSLWKTIVPSQSGKLQYKSPKIIIRKNYLEELESRFEKDKVLGQTSIGPHKDRINFYFGEIDVKDQASQGEKKLFLIVLKVAEANYIYSVTNKKPVLLLDDLFAKLDMARGEKILQLINNKYQTFITTTDNDVESYFKNSRKINLIKLENNSELCSVA